MSFKNLKIVKQIKSLSPKLKWLMFSKIQDFKIGSKYMDLLIPNKDTQSDYDKKLESMVRETLIREFSPDIQKNKSYEVLVDAVIHNIKKKQLGDDVDIKELK